MQIMTKTLKRLLNEFENLGIDYVRINNGAAEHIRITSLDICTTIYITQTTESSICTILDDETNTYELNKKNFHLILSLIVEKYFN